MVEYVVVRDEEGKAVLKEVKQKLKKEDKSKKK